MWKGCSTNARTDAADGGNDGAGGQKGGSGSGSGAAGHLRCGHDCQQYRLYIAPVQPGTCGAAMVPAVQT